MIWNLLPHVSACIASDRVILLDIRQDRYFEVPGALTSSVTQWLVATVPSECPAALSALLSGTGVVRRGERGASILSTERLAVPGAWPVPEPTPVAMPLGELTRLVVIVLATWLSLRLFPLEHVLARHRHRSAAARPACDLAGRAAGFNRARRLVPVTPNCLLDSLALDRWLGGRGTGRRLVLGVAARPFAAHCWLQSDSMLLNDSYDRVSRYTPILAL